MKVNVEKTSLRHIEFATVTAMKTESLLNRSVLRCFASWAVSATAGAVLLCALNSAFANVIEAPVGETPIKISSLNGFCRFDEKNKDVVRLLKALLPDQNRLIAVFGDEAALAEVMSAIEWPRSGVKEWRNALLAINGAGLSAQTTSDSEHERIIAEARKRLPQQLFNFAFTLALGLALASALVARSRRKRSVVEDEDDAYELLTEATTLERKGDLNGALAKYEAIITKAPGSNAAKDAEISIRALRKRMNG